KKRPAKGEPSFYYFEGETRFAADAEPSQVCGLLSQHQPRLGCLFPLIHIAGTRWLPGTREAKSEKQLFLRRASGKWVITAMPSSSVSGRRLALRMRVSAALGVTLSV